MAKELFDLKDIDSLVRQLLRERGTINLRDFEIPHYEIYPSYKSVNFSFTQKNYKREMKEAVESVLGSLSGDQESYNSLYTALYEAVMNAYQHGNKQNPNKKVTIAYKINPKSAEIAVIDEGGTLDMEFIPFVLMHKGKKLEKFLNFYEFTGRPKPITNNGTGTSFMHTYVDEVFYFKSGNGGLVVHLTKELKKKG